MEHDQVFAPGYEKYVQALILLLAMVMFSRSMVGASVAKK
jgi:hypothetical protein